MSSTPAGSSPVASPSAPATSSPDSPADPSNASEHFSNVERLRLLIGALVAFGLFRLAGEWLRLPLVPQFSASLLQDGAILGLIAVAVLFVVVTVLATVIVGRFRFEAGLFCAAVGLIAIPTRGGEITQALLSADGSRSTYLILATEQVLLGAIVLAGYWVQSKFHRIPPAVAPASDPDTVRDRVITVVAQALCLLLLMALVGQSPAKGQALVGVGVCSLGAALLTSQAYKVRGSEWYILGTLLAGLIAYLYTFFGGASGAAIGEVRGYLAGPARSLPLHYASLGIAGAIYGYWISMVWIGPRK